MKKKILFLSPYPFGTAPSQRFRFEQYFNALQENGFEFVQKPFWSEKTWGILYQKGNFLTKAFGLLSAIFKRYLLIFGIGKYDYVFIHREFSPVGLPFMVWIFSRILRKKIIFDFDDAIWIPNISKSNKSFGFIKVYGNTRRIIQMSYKVSCGNEYLQNFANQYNPNDVYNPTTIDTEGYHNQVRQRTGEKFVIGWTGSHSTMKYLKEIIPVISKLEKEFPIEFHVISDQNPNYELESFVYKPWKKETEILDLLRFDVGIMPLKHDPWSEGKCGFKALQYMALGIPALASPLGVNTTIVDHGIDGYYCRTLPEWEHYLRALITHSDLLDEMSNKTREKIEANYSVKSNTQNFLGLFS